MIDYKEIQPIQERLDKIIDKQLELIEKLQELSEKAVLSRSLVPIFNESLWEASKVLAQLTEARKNMEAIN